LGFFSFIFFSSATNRVSPLAVLSQSSPRLRVHSATLILRAHFRHEEIPSSARKQVVCRLFEHGEQYDQSARQRQEASNPWWSARCTKDGVCSSFTADSDSSGSISCTASRHCRSRCKGGGAHHVLGSRSKRNGCHAGAGSRS